MRPLSARKYPRLYAVLLALGLILAVLQQASAHHSPIPQHTGMPANLPSQHQASAHDSSNCTAECISTVQHCCLYALSSKQPLSVFIPGSVPSSVLAFFFNSRPITPQTPPPKTVQCC